MKVRIFSEEFPPEGREADWPVIPRVGEIVSFDHLGGTSNLKVDEVRWMADTHGALVEVVIGLTF